MTNEDEEDVEITTEIYKKFFTNYLNGWKTIIPVLALMGFYLVSKVLTDYLMGHWAKSDD